jgi:membrane fusion protein YbhG
VKFCSSYTRRNCKCLRPIALAVLTFFFVSCQQRDDTVSGTIEVDEVHVAPRSGGRVEKILAQEGDTLKAGDLIAELDAAELKAQRDVALAQINQTEHDAEAHAAQLEFLRADAKRQQDLLKSRAVSPNDSERAVSAAKAQERNLAAAQVRIVQMKAQLASIDAQLSEMKVVAPGPSILEILSVKIGDVLPPNREVATLILPQHLWVRVYVPETWLGLIKLGDIVRVRVDSFPDQDFSGTVEQINRQAEFTPRNVQTVEDRIRQVFGVKVRLKSEDKLRAGMSADVYFPNVKS